MDIPDMSQSTPANYSPAAPVQGYSTHARLAQYLPSLAFYFKPSDCASFRRIETRTFGSKYGLVYSQNHIDAQLKLYSNLLWNFRIAQSRPSRAPWTRPIFYRKVWFWAVEWGRNFPYLEKSDSQYDLWKEMTHLSRWFLLCPDRPFLGELLYAKFTSHWFHVTEHGIDHPQGCVVQVLDATGFPLDSPIALDDVPDWSQNVTNFNKHLARIRAVHARETETKRMIKERKTECDKLLSKASLLVEVVSDSEDEDQDNKVDDLKEGERHFYAHDKWVKNYGEEWF